MATEVGVGYVRLIPSMRGFSGETTKLLKSGLKGPAQDAGKSLGDGISDGVGRSEGRIRGSAGKLAGFFTAALASAGVAGALLLAKGFSDALDQGAMVDKLEAQIGGEWGKAAGQLAGNLYSEGFGQSIADTGDALRQVLQGGLIDEDATDAVWEDVTAKALTFADVMDQDLSGAIEGVSSMLRSGLVDSAEEGFDVLTRGIQEGADRSGDLTESFKEYSTLFRDLGLDATEATGLLSQGLASGARDADQVADALKELAIRAQDGSKASAEGFALIGLNAEEMTAKFAAGGEAAKEGLGQVLDGLKDIEDPVERNAAAVALFGAKAEDLGDALFALDLDDAAAGLGDVAGATEGLGSAYDNAATKLEIFKRKGMMKLTEFLGGTLIPMLEDVAEDIMPTLREAFEEMKPALKELGPILVDAFKELAPVLADIVKASPPIIKFVVKLAGWLTKLQVDKVKSLAAGFSAVSSVIGAVTGFVRDAFDWFKKLGNAAVDAKNWIADGMTTARDKVAGFASLVSEKVSAIKGWFGDLRNKIPADWGSAMAAVRTKATDAKDWVKGKVDDIVAFFRNLPQRIFDALSGLKDKLLKRFDDAIGPIVSLWNNTIGKLGGPTVNIPSPSYSYTKGGGKRPRSTYVARKPGGVFHEGGIVPGRTGEEVPIIAQAGEHVFTPGQINAISSAPAATAAAPIKVSMDMSALPEEWKRWMRRTVRVEGGGNVQLAFGQV